MATVTLLPQSLRPLLHVLLLLLLLLVATFAAAAAAPAHSAVPLRYNVTLAPFIYSQNRSQFHLAGSVRIAFTVRNGTRQLALHAGLRLRMGDTLVQDGTRNVSIVGTEQRDNITIAGVIMQLHVLTLSEELNAGKEYTLSVYRYRGQLSNTELYAERNNSLPAMGLEISAFVPCLTNPWLKSTFSVSIVRRSDSGAATHTESVDNSTEANALAWWPEVDVEENVNATQSEWIRETFAETPSMPAVSLQLVVSQMQMAALRTDAAGRQHRFWTTNRTTVKESFSAISEDIVLMHQLFEKRYGVKYPVNKVDYFLFPMRGSEEAMHFSIGIVTARVPLSFLNDTYRGTHEMVAYWIGAAMSHVWVRYIAGVDSESDKWVTDSLIDTESYVTLSAQRPEMRTYTIGVDSISKRWYDYLFCKSNPAAQRHCINGAIRMMFLQLRYAIGAEAFDLGVRDFVQKYKFSSAPRSALFDLLTARARQRNPAINVTQLMEAWVQQDGIPLVSCSVQGSQLVLQQRNLNDTGKVDIIPIPIAMATSDNSTRDRWNGTEEWSNVQWLTQRQQSFASFNESRRPSWYLLKLRGAGLYRVNYDAENWAALAQQLRDDHTVLHPYERAILIADSVSLVETGLLNISVVLDLISDAYVAKETHFFPQNLISLTVFKFGTPNVPPSVKDALCELKRPLNMSLGSVNEQQSTAPSAASAGYRPVLAREPTDLLSWLRSDFVSYRSLMFSGLTLLCDMPAVRPPSK